MMKKITLLIFFLILSNSFAQSEEQNNLFYLNEITKHCVMEGSGSNVKRIGLGTGFNHRNINNEYSEINNCSELKLGYNNETWEEISALEFCEKYFDGTGKNSTTKSLILTKYPECIISETPFRLDEFTKQELIENNLVSRLNYEDSLLEINEYIAKQRDSVLSDVELKEESISILNQDEDVYVINNSGYNISFCQNTKNTNEVYIRLFDCPSNNEINYKIFKIKKSQKLNIDINEFDDWFKNQHNIAWMKSINNNFAKIHNKALDAGDRYFVDDDGEEYLVGREKIKFIKIKNIKNIVANKTNDSFIYCERKSTRSLYYRIKDRGCLESDSEISRGDFEYLVRNFDTIIECKMKDGVENCTSVMLLSISKEYCTNLFTYNSSNSYTKSDNEVIRHCDKLIDNKNYIFEESITAELDFNESNNSSKKFKVETNIDKVSLKKELEYWKELFEDELITKAEYDAKRKELLNQPITKTKVKSNKSINNNSNQTEKVIKEVSIDKSYQNKNYLYEKIDRKLFPMPTDRIFKNCNKDYRKILEQIKCSKDNLRATHRYKKRLKYFDIYELHVTTLDTIEDLILKGQLTEMQAKSNVASLNTQTINILDNRAELNRQKYERIGKLGQQLADPNYDITTGTYKNQNNNNTFQNQNNQSCMYNPATDDYQICLHKGAEQNSCFHFGNQCTP